MISYTTHRYKGRFDEWRIYNEAFKYAYKLARSKSVDVPISSQDIKQYEKSLSKGDFLYTKK